LGFDGETKNAREGIETGELGAYKAANLMEKQKMPERALKPSLREVWPFMLFILMEKQKMPERALMRMAELVIAVY
jgi:hypothetical protein